MGASTQSSSSAPQGKGMPQSTRIQAQGSLPVDANGVPQAPVNTSQFQTADLPAKPQGKGGSVTTPVTSGQPQMGVPNQYANTIQSGDNTTTQQSPMPQGKGGAVSGSTPRGKGM
jgi:hypothetical protein